MPRSLYLRTLYTRIRHAGRAFLRHPAADRRAVIRASVVVFTIGWLLRVMPFARLKKVLAWGGTAVSSTGRGHNAPGDRPGNRPGNRTRQEQRILWSVSVAAQHLFPKRPCLPQALAAQFLLRRAGFPVPEVRFGVKRSLGTDTLAAHAWLERDGHVVLGGSESPHRYRALIPPLQDRSQHPFRRGQSR